MNPSESSRRIVAWRSNGSGHRSCASKTPPAFGAGPAANFVVLALTLFGGRIRDQRLNRLASMLRECRDVDEPRDLRVGAGFLPRWLSALSNTPAKSPIRILVARRRSAGNFRFLAPRPPALPTPEAVNGGSTVKAAMRAHRSPHLTAPRRRPSSRPPANSSQPREDHPPQACW